MKKLLVTAIGAAAAFGAFADTISQQAIGDIGTTGDKTVAELNAALGNYWSEPAGATNTYTVSDLSSVGQIDTPISPISGKSLDIKTTFGKPLSVDISEQQNGVSVPTAIPGSGLYFDSLVKFTVCEDAPADSYANAKIIMWLQEVQDSNGNPTGTNLWVRAGYLTSPGNVVATNYQCGTAIDGAFADAWHRVTIKAMADMTVDGGLGHIAVPGFAIFIDSTRTVICDDPKWAGEFVLTEAADHYTQAGLFPSMIQDEYDTSKGTLTCASFDGTGSMTDITFTDDAPIAAAEDYVAPKAGVTINDVEQDNIITLADAIGAANGAAADAEVVITLSKDFEFDAPVTIDPENSGVTVVLDFAGYVIENTGSECLITNTAALTVTDSNAEATGGIIGKAIYQGDGSLVIEGGNFWTAGAFDLDNATDVLISGGSFADDETAFETEETESGTWIEDGKKLEENAETGLYDVVEDVGPVEPTTWAELLGAAVDGAYEIDDLAELKAFQAKMGTAEGFATAGVTFKLTANITLDEAWPGIGIQNGKDIYSTAEFDEGAFCGTFDGQNYTISGFQMVGVAGNPKNNGEGLDYCGFFNSTYGATIQNLKIQYAGSLFAADTTASTKESGATFVGVAKNSTLRNLTTVAGTVSCSKGFGGIVGFLTSGTTVDSCTNNVNMTSLANNKCGGIAMITQGGSAVTISNCQNNGTQTTGSSNSEYGAIVGYVGLDTTIANCETTVGRFLKHQSGTITLQGVNKGDATVLAYHGTATPGLNFATVDGNVATFVADNALALDGEYKVMAAGTATFEFAEAGTIAFDQTLATPTYAVTADESLILTDATADGVKTYTAVVPGAVIGDAKFATLEEALASPLVTNATVKLMQDATTGAISTPAAMLDLNGKTLTLSGTTEVTFTGTGAKTLKGGDLMGVYHELTITAPAGENLTFDGMTFHASVKPNGSGDLFTATNCQFLCDFDKTGAAFTDGSSADVHSYGVLFNSNSLFKQADIVNNYFDQGRRAAVQASFAGDLYFYGNTVVADKLTSRVDGAATRYPALQTMTHGRVFIENNTFSGQYLGEAFCLYNKEGYRSTDAAVVFSGNTVGNGVNYLWGIFDSAKTGTAPLVTPNLYFGSNTVDANVDTTGCIYKTTVDGTDMNGVTYSHTPATLALPAGVDSVYAWTHAAGAKPYYVDGVAADAVSAGTVIAVPGVAVASDTCILTADATLKNQYTAAAAAAKIGTTLYATLKDAVDAANAGDTVTTLTDCTVTASVSFTKNITVHNDYTIAANVNYALCVGATVTFEGSGMIQRGSTISGSAFCVGANETTRGAITAGTVGTLIFNGGTICGGNGGNQIKLENGTVEMNGGVLKDGLRGIKADADAGSYTSAIVINGGTITNCSAYAVFASAESATGKATITINGGVISGVVGKAGKGDETITIPGTSTAKFDADQSAFCETGYETTQDSDGWYVVTAVPPAPSGIDPASDTPSADVSAASADAAIEAVEVEAPAEAGSTPEAKAAYKALFDYEAVETSAGSGVYTVTMTGIKDEVEEDVEKSAMDVLDGKSGAKVEVPAGLCYKVTTYTALGGDAVETKSGTSNGTGVSVSKPGTTQGFIKVEMATKPLN